MDHMTNQTIRRVWSESVARNPESTYLIYEDDEGLETAATYAEFNEQINRTARSLHDQHGIRKGDTFVLHLENSPAFLQTWYGLMKIGAIPAPSNTDNTPREIEYAVTQAEAKHVLTEPQYLETVRDALQDVDVEEIIVGRTDGEDEHGGHATLDAMTADADPLLPEIELDSQDPGQILYTSGTTGNPKGVIFTHENLIRSGLRMRHHLAMQETDRFLTALPLFHANAQSMGALPCLMSSATLVLIESFSASKFSTQIRKHGATLTSLINTQARTILLQPESPTDADNDLRAIFFGINVTENEKEEFEGRFGARFVNSYGLSEATTAVVSSPVYGKQGWPAAGVPLYDRDVYIVDEDENRLELGDVGEIAVDGTRGKSIFKEYYNMPEETEDTFTEDGLLLTGDYGRLDEEGYLYFVDRKKNIIKTRGENVSENEVEGVLADHAGIADVCVIGIPHHIYDEAVLAVVKPTEDADLTADEVIAYAEEHLAEFKLPHEVEFVESLPRTGVGKVEKSKLRPKYEEQYED
jgi:crotonobetaine/carnitine-CoA ligase